MPKRSDDFPPNVIKTVRERAGGICSRPTCNRLTMGPHTDPNKAKIVGVAAHICAASKKGPRYDPHQTSGERRNIRNAIWLCVQCGTEVDKDTSPFSKETLEDWKATHERYVSTIGGMGFREAFLSAPLTSSDAKIARQMMSFFEDRRVLSELLSNEVPTYMRHSVERIREQLWRWKAELPYNSELARKIGFMRRACLEFLDDAGHMDSHLPIGHSVSGWEQLDTALKAFRKVMGRHIADVADKYDLPILPMVERIVPRADDIGAK